MTETSEFEKVRDELKAYILDNGLLPQLMLDAQFTSRSTFYAAFNKNYLSENQLTVRHRIIWKKAIYLMENSESIFTKALRVISQ